MTRVKLLEAIKPGLEPMPGDCVKFPGKVGGKSKTIIIWQGIERELVDWARAMGCSRSSLRYRLGAMPLRYAMDKTYTVSKVPGYKQPPEITKEIEREPIQGIDYEYIPPVKALLPLPKEDRNYR